MNSPQRPLLIAALSLVSVVVVAGLMWQMTATTGPVQSTVANSARAIATRPPPPAEGYVGDSTCAECHAAVVEQFSTHPMSRSMATVGQDSTFQTFDKELSIHPGGRCEYRVRQVGESELVHEERMLDEQGQEIYDQKFPVQYSIGSGHRGRSYIANHDGLLFMSSISWYAKGNRWDLSPGYTPDDSRGFSRRILDECLGCHAGRVAVEPGTRGRYAANPFPQMSIGCENCHGPGKLHVQAKRSPSPSHKSGGLARPRKTAIEEDPIVNPAKLAAVQRESICNQCHLQAAARIPRYGRSYFDFRPGQRLDEVLTVFLSGDGITQDGKTKSVSHVQQMMASQCYVKSNGEFGCTSCHDPHRVPPAAEKPDFYRGRCLKCHENMDCKIPLAERESHENKNSCFECHMPRLQAVDIAHTAQTDHRVLAKPDHALTSGSQGQLDRLAFFDGADQRLPEWEVNRALGLAIVHHSLKHGRMPDFSKVEQVLLPGLQFAPDDLPVMTSLIQLALKVGNTAAAEKYAKLALLKDSQNEAALTALVMLRYQEGRNTEGLEYANRLVQFNPRDNTVQAQRADMLRLTGNLPEGIRAAEQGLQANPRLIPLRRWLSNAYRTAGDQAKSDEQMAIIRRIETAPVVK
jgi:hypothetical protein